MQSPAIHSVAKLRCLESVIEDVRPWQQEVSRHLIFCSVTVAECVHHDRRCMM